VAQISVPFRIALVAVLAAGALWMTVLKPKPAEEAPLPKAPGATGLGNAVSKAKGAVAKSNAASAKTQAATGGIAAATTTAKAKTHAAVAATSSTGSSHAAKAAKTARAAKAGDRSAALIHALDARKTVVLLFWNRRGADDRAVRTAVRGLPTHGGKVVTKVVPISQVGRYEAITSGAQVLEAPTTLVIGPDRKAHPIVGFTTAAEIGQQVDDALAAAKK
jgi:hypothetical protein